MDNFLKMPYSGKLDILTEVSNKMGINATVIEKDFWVCWTLNQLFSNKLLFDNMIFKGGTSLSKSYGLIQRFSEDCDLTINKQLFDIQDPKEPGISNKELQRIIDMLIEQTKIYVRETIFSILESLCKDKLEGVWSLTIDQDELTILFSYPSVYTLVNEYIVPTIRLELGARGGILPKQTTTIKPYVAESFPSLITEENILIPTLSPERTFWEKLTILHSLYHRRLKGKTIAERMSRHYYDVYMLAQAGIAEKAMMDLGCLEDVLANNILFFKDNNASQDTAKLGSFHLVPSSDALNDLRKDYANMEVMILGDYPTFDKIIEVIQDLESKLNRIN